MPVTDGGIVQEDLQFRGIRSKTRQYLRAHTGLLRFGKNVRGFWLTPDNVVSFVLEIQKIYNLEIMSNEWAKSENCAVLCDISIVIKLGQQVGMAKIDKN